MVLHLFNYLIFSIFSNFRVWFGGGVYLRKFKLSKRFRRNLFEVLRYLMPPMEHPMHDRVKSASDENVLRRA